MRFCTNCGEQLEEGVNFCPSCGKPVSNESEKRRQEFVGELRKCPNCGESINAFVAKCPSCGYEFSGVKATSSLQDFSRKLQLTQDEHQRATLINSFPVPNTREDIMEFVILASASISSAQTPAERDAWASKLNQVYEKGKIVLTDKEDLKRLEYIYKQGKNRLPKDKLDKLDKSFFRVGTAFTILGILLIATVLFNSDKGALGNIRPLMTGVFLCCSGALSILYTKNRSVLTYLRVSYIYNIIVNAFFIKYYMAHTLIVIALAYALYLSIRVKPEISAETPEDLSERIQKLSRQKIIAIAVAVVLLVATVVISTIQENHYRSQPITWKNEGLYSVIPEPITKTGKIIQDDENTLLVNLYHIDEDEYEAYKESCKENGFNIDGDTSNTGYKATSEDGCELRLFFDEDREEMSITVKKEQDY